ncbi:MAG: carboxymuconolactone decarboxylase family protein [Halobacteriales archaeon]
MAIVDLLDDNEYDEHVQQLDERVRQYTGAPGMTPYVKAAGHYPPLLGQMGSEHLVVMTSDALRREQKELIAIAVSMVNNCAYCIGAHAHLHQQMFGTTDAELVELVGAVSHVSGLNRFEHAVFRDGIDDPRFPAKDPADVPLLADIEEALGRLPEYYRVMANDPDYLEEVWTRERVTLLEGSLDRVDKELVAWAVSVVNDADYSTRLREALLDELGVTDEQLFEALQAIEIFQKNNVYTSGLQLEAGLWARDD